MITQFDHLDLDESDRAFIKEACHSPRISLAPLDKGASGSRVWQAEWVLESGWPSRRFVLKIGPVAKLHREHAAIRDLVDAIDPRSGNAELFLLPDWPDTALLRQEFGGKGLSGGIVSLRNHLATNVASADDAEQLMTKLFCTRMQPWHAPVRAASFAPVVQTESYATALDWWVSRTDLGRSATEVGRRGLERSLNGMFGLNLHEMEARVAELSAKTDDFTIGPVHGDLHAQNVLVDEAGHLHLIDFGWTAHRWRAIDFLMLECSLKFLVAPPHARLDDLLRLEDAIDAAAGGLTPGESLDDSMYAAELVNVAAAVGRIRSLALTLGAVRDETQYKRGLIVLTAGLASIRHEINRTSLFHSLGRLLDGRVPL